MESVRRSLLVLLFLVLVGTLGIRENDKEIGLANAFRENRFDSRGVFLCPVAWARFRLEGVS